MQSCSLFYKHFCPKGWSCVVCTWRKMSCDYCVFMCCLQQPYWPPGPMPGMDPNIPPMGMPPWGHQPPGGDRQFWDNRRRDRPPDGPGGMMDMEMEPMEDGALGQSCTNCDCDQVHWIRSKGSIVLWFVLKGVPILFEGKVIFVLR